MSTVAILLSAFVLSFVALLLFIWSKRTGLFNRSSKGAEVIFVSGEIGRIEEPVKYDFRPEPIQQERLMVGHGQGCSPATPPPPTTLLCRADRRSVAS